MKSLLVGVAFFVLGAPVLAQDVMLTSSANSEPDIEGYKIHYGSHSRNYSVVVDAGNLTSHTVTGLAAGDYYFALTAYNRLGLESSFSQEVLASVGPPFVTTLSFPRLVSSPGSQSGQTDTETTGLAIVSLDPEDASIRFTALGVDGEPLTGASVRNPVSLHLDRGTQLPILDNQVFGTGWLNLAADGWLKLESTTAQITGFFLSFDDDLSILDGADVSSTVLTDFLFPEIEKDGFTTIHIANPGSEEASLSFELNDGLGSSRATISRKIAPNGAISERLKDLFPGVETSTSDYIKARSNRPVVPFEYLGKAGLFVQGLNGQDSSSGAHRLYSPQYAVGGSLRSTLSVVNLLSIAGSVQFRFFSDDGSQIGSTFVRRVEPLGKLYVDDQDFFLPSRQDLLQGYVEITSDGPWISGNVVLGDPERTRFSSALPLISDLSTSFVFGHVASDESYFMGVVLLNPHDETISATLEIHESQGNLLGMRTVMIPGKQRVSLLLTEWFKDLVGVNLESGYIRTTADLGVAAFALFGTKDLNVLSAVPAQQVPR